jgi:16S rRNA processing protein RimM
MPGKREKPAGSLKTGEPVFLAVGKIRRPHGLNGAVLMELYTDFPERLVPGKDVYWGEEHRKITICNQRPHKDGLLLSFEGLLTPEQVGQLRNQYLYVPTKDAPGLSEGEYFYHQLLGIEVVLDSGDDLGKLTEVIETGANDVYVVTTSSGVEVLLPAIKDVVKAIDLDEHRMVVHLLPGLIDTPTIDGMG